MESKWLWMVMIALLLGGWCDGCWEQEKAALSQLKPFFSDIWDEGKQSSDCCEWEWVECNISTGRVMQLFLNLTTTEVLPDIVYNPDMYEYDYYGGRYYIRRGEWYLNASLFLPFKELKSLHLSGNSIAGCVYNEGFERLSSKLDKLEILDLSDNHFSDSILTSISELSSLKFLNLGYNQLTGSSPTDGITRLSKLNNLKMLNLAGNKLGNNILSHLNGFISLRSLRLQNCGLKGDVDMLEINNLINLRELYLAQNEIGSLRSLFQSKRQLKLVKLEVLDLSYNLFNNIIFSSLAVLPNLKSLYIRGNRLKGPLYIKELNALSNLKELYMSDNAVNDIVPSQDNQKYLQVLDLEWNPLNDSILPSFSRFSNLKSLSFTLLHKILEESTDLKALNALKNLDHLSVDCITAQGRACNLPPNSLGVFLSSLKTLFLYGFSFNGTMSTKKVHSFRNLEELNLYGCFLQTNILGTFGELTSLKRLHLSFSEINNNGSLTPPQEVHGLRNLEELRLYKCFLQTNLLGTFGELTSLKRLDLGDCEINHNGSLTPPQGPLNLKSLESLVVLETSVEDKFLQRIGAMPSLKFLRLLNCGLNGTLYTKGICELTNLQVLDVRQNNIKDNLPMCFSNLTLLERLDLSSNQFSGNISAIKSLTSLQTLSLSNNYFQIPISLEPFFNLSKLKYFEADNNTIYAETKLHSLAPTFQLNGISIACCGDVGSFPQFLYHQHDLQYVDLSNIHFKGEQFPVWLLENNTKLATLILTNSSLSGPFHVSFPLHFGLTELVISINFFTGSIPLEIGAQLPSLRALNLSNNHFNGNIPSSFGDISSLYSLDLSNNQLSGGIPEHLAMGCSSLEVLALSNNTLEGKIFYENFNLRNLKELHLDGNNFSGRIPDLSNNSYLFTLDLSNNQLSGRIPRWMGKMFLLEKIIMSNNHLEGTIPMEFCQLVSIVLLDLSFNNISGSLPSCFSPSRIKQVHLSKNRLRGALTDALRNSSTLVTLDISYNFLNGSIPSWIGGLSNLNYLLLSYNYFEGHMPMELCNLSHLSLIALSHNNLSGHIPPCLKITALEDASEDYFDGFVVGGPVSFSFNEPIEFTTKNVSRPYKGKILPYMAGIDLSYNNLVGKIPSEIGNFRKIIVLSLSHNRLTGSIPRTFANLMQMETLDLSFNNLSGNIPQEFAMLHFLSYFNVSYNNLSGRTPERIGQLGAFDESCYLGNLFLCGTLVQKNCSPMEPPLTPKASTGNREGNGLIDMDVFHVSFIVSYIIVLLSIAVILYINPYWRQAWFYHVEMGANSCYYFVVDNLPRRIRCGNM
ncbi:hypothetical protein DITRI_Ditri07aG0035000 [Diplodiscus trichospermus]